MLGWSASRGDLSLSACPVLGFQLWTDVPVWSGLNMGSED